MNAVIRCEKGRPKILIAYFYSKSMQLKEATLTIMCNRGLSCDIFFVFYSLYVKCFDKSQIHINESFRADFITDKGKYHE